MNVFRGSDLDEKFILAIDLGSTNLKVAIFNSELHRLSSRSFRLIYNNDRDKIEFDANKVWKILIDNIDGTCKDASIKKSSIGIISITSQSGSFTVIDKNGEPKIPFISWLDKRAKDESEKLSKIFNEKRTQNQNIILVSPQSVLAKILWVKNNSGSGIGKDDLICPMPSFITYKLTGISYMCHNLAQLFDPYLVREDDWSDNIIDILGIKKNQLPVIVKTGTSILIKEPVKELDLKKGTKIILAGNDQTANAVGNLLFENEVLISIGTAMIVYLLMGKKVSQFNKEIIRGPYINNTYYKMFASDYGTYSLDCEIENICGKTKFDEFNHLAAQCLSSKNNSRQTFFYPHFTDLNKAWVGEGSRSEKALAVFEGMAFYIKFILEEIIRINYKTRTLYISGGGNKNGLLLEIISSTLNRPVLQSNGDSLLGAAIIANEKNINKQKIIHEKFLPDKRLVHIYKGLYRKWLENC